MEQDLHTVEEHCKALGRKNGVDADEEGFAQYSTTNTCVSCNKEKQRELACFNPDDDLYLDSIHCIKQEEKEQQKY